MFMKHADGCSEHNKYQMKWVVLFLSTFNFNIWCVHLLKQLQQHISLACVNIFPEHFNTNVIPCLLQLKPKAFLWMYNRSDQFIFQLAPNLLDGVEVRTLRRPVHHFQCSSRFLPSQVVPAIVCFMGTVMIQQLKPLKYAKCSNNFGHHCKCALCCTVQRPWFTDV